jgi:hypothetical protein
VTSSPVSKRFVYLFQTPRDLPAHLEEAASDDSDVLFLSWQEPSSDPRSVYYPSSSWTQGRNRLYKAVQDRGYQYFVFCDSDIRLRVNGGANAGENPWRMFEAFLTKWRPALGTPHYDWHLSGFLDLSRECQTIRFPDAILNAIHREAAAALLPYLDLLDEWSICYPQVIVAAIATDLYRGHVLQDNRLVVDNLGHVRTQDAESLLSRPEDLYLESRRDRSTEETFLRWPAIALLMPEAGVPSLKTGSYELSETELARLYDLGHPVWTRRRELLALREDDTFFSSRSDTARAERWRGRQGKRGASHPLSARLAWRMEAWLARIGLARGGRAHALITTALTVLRRRPMASQYRAMWRRWWRTPGLTFDASSAPRVDAVELLASALHDARADRVVVVEAGVARGELTQRLRACWSSTTPLFPIGIATDPAAHRVFPGFVAAPPVDPRASLSIVTAQYGLAGHTLHVIRVTSTAESVLDARRYLGETADRCLFLQAVGVPEQARALESAGWRPVVVADDEITYANVELFGRLLPELTR